MKYDPKIQLKKLSLIEPDADFVRRVRVSFVRSERRGSSKWFAGFSARLLMPAFAAFMIFVGVIYQYFSKPLTVSAFDETSINQEFTSNVGVALTDITNTQNVNQTISSAITEIGDTKTPHLSPTLLRSESQIANPVDLSTSTDDVDSLLNQVLQ